jgi:hypothetical protein
MNGVLKLKTVNYVEILFMVISIISLGISAVSIFWTIKTKNRYEKYVKKLGNGSNIAEALDEYIKQVENIEKRDDQILEYCTALNAELGRCIKKIGIVRYDMFENNRSKLSFALALLDRKNTGVVINSIYAEDNSNVYAKPVVNGLSKYQLSFEEEEAIRQASIK